MKRTIKTFFMTLLLALVCAFTAFGFTSCFSQTRAVITLDNETLQLYVNGKEGTIRAMLEPKDNTAVYEWTIDDSTVATIKPTQSVCKVSPLKEGTATITVTAGGATATCKVTVGGDQHVQLQAPSFTYDQKTGVITITDPNANGVGSYRLDFYAEGSTEVAGSVEVKNGEEVDIRRIDQGTYTVKLVAVGANDLYLESEPSTTTAKIVVATEALYELGTGDTAALEAENHWAYYKYDWVIVDTEQAYFYDGVVNFSFSNNTADSTSYQWITQLIYNYGKGEEGKLYKMVLNINTTSEGRVTLGDKRVTLHEGDNLVTVAIDGANLFKIQFGVSGEYNTMKESTIQISIVGDIVETETMQLAIPESFTYNANTNTINIVDTVNSEYDVNYTLGFFENEEDASPKGTAIVVNGGEVDTTSVGSGTYYLKLMAATTGKPYSSSDWSEVQGQISLVNDYVPVPNGGQASSASTPNKWYEWHATNAQSSGAETVIDEVYVNADGDVYITYHVESGNTHQPVKLHYNDAAINEGDVYTFTCTITSEVEGYITVNGKIFELQVGDNQISVTRAQPNKTNGGGMRTTITIQMGAQLGEENGGDVMVQGSFVISNITLTKVDVVALEAPSFVYDNDTQIVTITDAAANAGKTTGYVIGFFESADAVDPMGTATVAEDGSFDSSLISSGTYYLRVKAVSTEIIYGDSEWSEVGGTVGVVTERVDIVAGNLAAAANTQNTWFFYQESTTTLGEDGIYLDENNDLHVGFSVAEGTNTDQPIKLFYNKSEYNEGDVYTLTCKIISPVAGYVTVNSEVFEIEEGVNEITVTRAQLNKTGSNTSRATIVIQFGAKPDGTTKVFVEGKFVVSEIVLKLVEVITLDTPSFTYNKDTQKVTITDSSANEGKVSNYVIGFFESESATVPMGTATVAEDGSFDSSVIGSGTYYLKVKAVATEIIYNDSEWSEVGGTVGVVTERVDIVAGNLAAANATQNTWFYYKESTTTIGEDGVYLDENNDVHATFSVTDGTTTDQPLKLFYNKSDINEGDEYTLTLTITSSMQGYINVNGKVFEIKEGENKITVTRVQPNKASGASDRATIVIQFGAKPDGTTKVFVEGEFVVSDITLTRVEAE